MNWLTRNWKIATVTSSLAAAAAVGVLWSNGTPSLPRPLLVGIKQDSHSYILRHAQPSLSPPSSATAWVNCPMQEASGNLSCTTEGVPVTLTANGTPVYRVHTPIPKSDGLTQRAIWFNGTDAKFVDSGSTAGNITTNNASVSFWLCNATPSGAGQYPAIVGKGLANQTGWMVHFDQNNGPLYVWVKDTVITQCAVSTGSLVHAGCHYYTVNFNRSSNAYAYRDGEDLGVNCNIAARSGSWGNAASFSIGYQPSSPTYATGGISGLIVSNGLTTLAEHQALYKAFKVPTEISSYTQTSTRCYSHGNENGFGERLGCYGPGQWPMAYSSTLVNASRNPLGWGVPVYAAATNVIGYSREINSWTASGATLAANTGEGPDGSVTADKITFSANGQWVGKGAVGAGSVAAGERWCASLKYRVISGTCTDVWLWPNSDLGGGCSGNKVAFGSATAWTTLSTCERLICAKGIGIVATTHGSCVLEIADAQYEQNNVTPPCTTTAGNVSQTCNAPLIALNWSAKTATMPTELYRGEMVARTALTPWVHTAGYKRIIGKTADDKVLLTEGQLPSLVLYNQGGSIEGVVRGKPIQHTELSRKYHASWAMDTNEGLTNTRPRRYAALSVDGTYQHTTLEPRVRTAVDVQNKRDLNSSLLYLGGDSGSNQLNGVIESFELYGRPEQKVKVEHTHQETPCESCHGPGHEVITLDTTGAGYLANAAIPNLCDYTFGVAKANRWCWPGSELSGSLYDVHNGVALAPTGSPTYQVPSGLIARGQGRRGVFTASGVSHFITAPSTSTLAIGSSMGWTTSAIAMLTTTPATYATIHDSAGSNLSGYNMIIDPNLKLTCTIWDNQGTPKAFQRTSTAAISLNKLVHLTCVWTFTGGKWTADTYIDGVLSNGSSVDQTATSPVSNAQAMRIFSNSNAGWPWIGELYELTFRNVADSAATILANYKRSVQTGQFWTDDSNTVAHYKFNEATLTNGVGLKDHSGNGNHLTSVTGTPTPSYRAAPWPMGSGAVKPAVSVSLSNYYSSSGQVAVPVNEQPYSTAAWVRLSVDSNPPAAYALGMFGGGATSDWILQANVVTGRPRWRWKVGGTLATAEVTVNMFDGRWHLLAGKSTYSGGTWYTYVSLDGAAFVAGDTVTGDPSNNNSVLKIGTSSGTTNFEVHGAAVWKNYALTDADVSALFGSRDPTGGLLTYARTSTSTKGICYEVDNDPVEGLRVRCFRDNEVPYQWNTSHAAAGNEHIKLGLPRHSAVTNFVYNSETLNSWDGPTFASITADATTAPDGTKTADALVEDGSTNLHYVGHSTSATYGAVPTSSCVYLKAGVRSWAWFQVGGSSCFAKLSDCTTGICPGGAAGYGVGNGWCKFCFDWTAAASAYANYVGGATANGTSTYTGTNGSTALYAWGFFSNQAALRDVYCPTTTTASTTCSTPTSLYVAASNISSWTRAVGVISTMGVLTTSGGYVFDLYNGSNNNGLHRYSPSYLRIFDSSATLQQNVAGAFQNQTGVFGGIAVFDATNAFYGTRRVYGSDFASFYAGPWTTYTTDGATGWTPAASTNLHIGALNDGTLPLDGTVELISIHSGR